jgi:hypothetical protein
MFHRLDCRTGLCITCSSMDRDWKMDPLEKIKGKQGEDGYDFGLETSEGSIESRGGYWS